MIVVSAGMRSEEIIQAVISMSGKQITFIKKVGLKHYFQSTQEEIDAPDIKSLLKTNPRFSTLYTAVSLEK